MLIDDTASRSGEMIFAEIAKIKSERIVPVFRCKVKESVMSQYCGVIECQVAQADYEIGIS